MYLVIDANNMAYRAKHAYRLSYKGQDTSVLYGVIRMLQSLIERHNPYSVIMCWDGGVPNFRRELVPEYKAHRSHDEDPTYPVFIEQLRELENILPCFGVLQARRRGIEADDLMYQASRMLNDEVLIVTTDDDLLQAVTEGVSVLKPSKANTLATIEKFEELMGFPVEKFVDWKVLQGDGSDGIAGIKGIGPAWATKIVTGVKLSDRIQGYLNDYPTEKFDAAWDTISLAADRVGARKVLLDAEYTEYDNARVYKWLMQFGFSSIIEAGVTGTFGTLRQPIFNCDVQVPIVWDYKRYGKQQG